MSRHELGGAVFRRLGRVLLLLALAATPASLAADEPERGFFGLTPRLTAEGVKIVALTPGGPAEVAGVREGDVVVLLDGNPVPVGPGGGVLEPFARYRVGDRVELTVRRDGELKRFRVELGAVPPATRETQKRMEALDRKIRADRGGRSPVEAAHPARRAKLPPRCPARRPSTPSTGTAMPGSPSASRG